MYLKPNWRILTIGDGDFSFSTSLWNHFQPQQLTASVLDTQEALDTKYQFHSANQLTISDHQKILFGFDITKPETWPDKELLNAQFDLVIFQFPLVPAFEDPQFFHSLNNVSINTLNRLLLRQYLTQCRDYFLDPNGEQLCYITSKDVKPYNEWNIESSLSKNLANIQYLGSMPFNINSFPGYKIRNVDRDKHVKDTQGITYIWGTKKDLKQYDIELREALTAKSHFGENYCEMCNAGPFISNSDKRAHELTSKHKLMHKYETQYEAQINR